MNPFITLWKFGRPHTIIGTSTSVAALFIIAGAQVMVWPLHFWLALISAVACNVFITGYNQLVDVRLDRINKPDLPLASGELPVAAGKRIVWSALIISLGVALYLSVFLFGLVSLIALIGFLYSWKTVYLKRYHQHAALAITLVRGFLINAGFYLYFSGAGADIGAISNPIWLLIIFVSLFSLGISWFKDIPDMEGDKTERVASLAITIGSTDAFRVGVIIVLLGYAIGAIAPFFFAMDGVNPLVLAAGHIPLGIVFLVIAGRVDLQIQRSIKRFYLSFWGLFVLEYLLIALAALV